MGLLGFMPIIVSTCFVTYLALLDIREFRIPNQILFPGLILTLSSMSLVAALTGNFNQLLRALFGGLLSVSLFFVLHLLNPTGLGMGDVKLSALIGATLSWISFPVGLLGLAIAFIASGIFAIFQLALFSRPLNGVLPFAPFMLFGMSFVEFGLLL